jgi:ADP-ribose pyrophosphatase YjhB (NUDIX family)
MDKTIVAAGGIVENEKGELLMIFRKQHWDLPKGKLDEGETIEECAVREVEEETGLQNVELGELIDITLHRYEENNASVTKKTYWYKMNASSDNKLTPQVEEDIHEIKWVKKNELHSYLENTYLNIKYIISKALEK